VKVSIAFKLSFPPPPRPVRHGKGREGRERGGGGGGGEGGEEERRGGGGGT